MQDGLQRMLTFLNEIEARNIEHFITKYSPDGLTVTLTLFKVRIEVEFTPTEMHYSCFEGTEDVLTDERALWDMIKKFD